MPASYALTVYRGDTYSWDFVLWDDTDKTQPTDLTGVEVKAEIRDRPAGGVIIPLDLDVEGNIIHARLDAAASAQLPVPDAVWDLQLTYDTGTVVTIIGGAVKVTADVTDSSPPVAAPTARIRLTA